MSFGFFLLSAWLGLVPAPQTAQEAQRTIQHTVVVTATRIETPAREIGSSVTVVAGTEIERSRQPVLLDALRAVPGLALLQYGGPGAAASAFLRGSNSEHVLVMLDGVEVNDPMNPSRSFDLAHLAAGRIERVEVLRGPQSPLYGSDALGGVINILTRKGSGPARVSFTGRRARSRRLPPPSRRADRPASSTIRSACRASRRAGSRSHPRLWQGTKSPTGTRTRPSRAGRHRPREWKGSGAHRPRRGRRLGPRHIRRAGRGRPQLETDLPVDVHPGPGPGAPGGRRLGAKGRVLLCRGAAGERQSGGRSASL